MLKKMVVLSMVFGLLPGIALSADWYEKLQTTLNPNGVLSAYAQDYLDSFAKDLGAVMGGGTYHQGESLGLLGFDIGVAVPVKKIDDANMIVKQASVDTIALPIIQIEKGLPADIDIIARFTSYGGAMMYGVGLRYGIFKSDLPAMPGISVQAVYNKLDVNADLSKLSATTISADAVISIGLPIIKPYLGVGIDQTDVKPDSSITSLSGKAQNTHIEGGVNLTLIPFTYIKVAATSISGNMGYNAGLGIKF